MTIRELISDLTTAATVLGDYAEVKSLHGDRLVPINFTQIGGAHFVLWMKAPAKKAKRKIAATPERSQP